MRFQIIFIFLLSAGSLFAQQAIIRDTARLMPTYPFSDPDPTAKPGRIYPYFRFDGYTHEKTDQRWKMIEMENGHIRLGITPEIGGKVWYAYEKSENYPFVFSNQAVEFRDVALRGAWTSGGIEFNFGDFGHAPTTSSPVDYFIRKNDDGSVSCFIGAYDWASRTNWRVEIHLPPDKAYFSTKSTWINSSPLEQSYYNWSNAGFRAIGNLEFVFPGTHYIGHEGEYETYPLDSVGRDISFYEKNDFGSYKSYHVLGTHTDFYGGYWHDHNMGVGHYAPYHSKLGKKIWSWGLSREGMIWEGLLTDEDGPNVELQSGRLFNQAAVKSMYSPFKHVTFDPYAVDAWTERWFPIKETRGLTHAGKSGALNARVEHGWLKIDWMALEEQSDTLIIRSEGATLFEKNLSLKPLETVRDSIRWEGDADKLFIAVGDKVIASGKDESLRRPLEAPADFDWESEYGLLLRGKDLSAQRNYAEAEKFLLKALEANPHLLPALSQMAQIRYRQGAYEDALEFAKKGLSINTYDPEANYMWGLANETAGRAADAKDGYSVAALHPGYRAASLTRLAGLFVREKNWKRAEELIRECLEFHPQNAEAKEMMAIVLRRQGAGENAKRGLLEMLNEDPLNHFARFELFLTTGDEKYRSEFVKLIRQEFPHEVFLEIALRYYRLNLIDEALAVLDRSPEYPTVQLWQAFIHDKTGRTDLADRQLEMALASSPRLVFPFRHETLDALQWAAQRKPHWKWRYYEALIRWQNNQPERARRLFDEAGDGVDFAPFFLAKAQLHEENPQEAEKALKRARELEPESWRAGLKLTQFYVERGEKKTALEIAEQNYREHPEHYVVGLEYAQALALNRRYAAGLDVLGDLVMLPAEGATSARSLFSRTNILLAMENMKNSRWEKALQRLREAEKWPENLGAGEPFKPDNRVTRFLMAYVYEKMGSSENCKDAWRYIVDYYKRDASRAHPLGRVLGDLAKGGEKDYAQVAAALRDEASGLEERYLSEFLEVVK